MVKAAQGRMQAGRCSQENLRAEERRGAREGDGLGLDRLVVEACGMGGGGGSGDVIRIGGGRPVEVQGAVSLGAGCGQEVQKRPEGVREGRER